VLGDHVNVAARLCSHAAPRQTLVTDRVYGQVKDSSKLSFEPLAPIQVKGKAAAINIFLARRAG
jgi:adenylate cyclase